ncbi:MAG: FmdB family zinc ribbon protein [Carbonactinosporaceae bacterium]
MALYEYSCPDCGRFDVHRAMGTAPGSIDCPTCSRPARRAFSPPLLSQTPRTLGTLLDGEERSRESPEVVSERPSRPRPRSNPRPHPALARLPRP